jgi:Na+/melibiose symporter-like transporter
MRSGSESLGWLVTGLVAGWVALNLLHNGFLLNAALMVVLAAIFVLMIREPRREPASGASRMVAVDFKGLLKHRPLWMAAGFWMLIKFSPSFGTPLFYHQSETLRFTPQMVGYLGFASAAAGLLGSLCYMRLCRRIALHKLLWAGIALNAVAALAYFGYRSAGAALAIDAVYGLSTALAFMPIFDLLARATPKDFAAFGYALIFSLGSLSVSGSDVVGSWIYEHFGRSFSAMILLDSGTSALVLLAIPLLPKQLVSGKDGDTSPTG